MRAINMSKFSVEKAMRILNGSSSTRSRLSSASPTNSRTGFRNSTLNGQKNSLRESCDVRSTNEFSEIIGFPMLFSPAEGKTAGYKPHFNKKQLSFPFYPILKASLNVQSRHHHQYDSTSISFPSRRAFSNFSNHHAIENKLFDRIFYDRGKRFDSDYSRGDNDRASGNKREKKITKKEEKTEKKYPANKGSTEKEKILRDSCMSKTTHCYLNVAETKMISSISKPDKCSSGTKILQSFSAPSSSPPGSSVTRQRDSSINGPSSSELSSSGQMNKQNNQSNTNDIRYSPSNDRSKIKASNCNDSKHLESSETADLAKNDNSIKSSLFPSGNHASSISYTEKMRQCSASRFQRATKDPKQRISHDHSPGESDIAKSSNHSGRREFASKERVKCCLDIIAKESMDNLALPKPPRSSVDTSAGYTPKLTASGDCCFDQSRLGNRSSLLELSNSNPNGESFKYRLSKCPQNLHEIWQNCGKIGAAIPPDPLDRTKKRASRSSKWIFQRYIQKSGAARYTDTGKWRRQSYYSRQRIYKCTKPENLSDPTSIELNPCPPIIEDSQLFSPLIKSEKLAAKVKGERRQCTGLPKNNRCSKTYEMKMEESRKNIMVKKIRKTTICNRNFL